MAIENICKFFKYGYCKFSDRCRHRHIQAICEIEECDSSNCSLRHPRACKFFLNYGRCKFGDYCLYKHEKQARKGVENVATIKETILENLNLKLESFLKSYHERILHAEENLQIMKIKLESIAKSMEPKPTPDRNFSRDTSHGSNLRPSFVHSTPSPFQTRPGSSCCDHMCRSELLNDPDYDKCCPHRCRKPWT